MKFAVSMFIASTALLMGGDLHPAQSTDLTVHEWGTFTSVAGVNGEAIRWDALGCSSDLPGFVHDFGYRGFKRSITDTVRMETPVVYFYSPQALEAHVTVTFPQGLITEWYPQADQTTRGSTGVIEWRNIKVQPDASLALLTENKANRYYAARETDAAPLSVGDQNEKFLFYRGVGQFKIPLSARLSPDGKVVVENRGGAPVPSVILFENRGGRLGYRNVGTLTASATLDRPSLDSSFAPLRYDLETALVAQGLFPKEARAMVETWRDSWFEEGSRLIYIVPSSSLDTILPLQVEPAPSHTARVFVGRIELVTAETKLAVQEAIGAYDTSAIDRYSRFLEVIVNRISAEKSASEYQIAQLKQRVQNYKALTCR
jgi:hypothetical protein